MNSLGEDLLLNYFIYPDSIISESGEEEGSVSVPCDRSTGNIHLLSELLFLGFSFLVFIFIFYLNVIFFIIMDGQSSDDLVLWQVPDEDSVVGGGDNPVLDW